MPNELLNNQNKPFLQWNYDEENNWLYLNWIGFISKENVRKGCEKLLELLNERPAVFILNDNRELQGSFSESNQWIQENVLPKAVEAGLRYFAHILAPGVAGALSAQDLHRRLEGALETQVFGTHDKAITWLKEKQEAEKQQ